MKTMSELVERNPAKMSGATVFKGTRVPLETFFDYLEWGYSVDEFLVNFPDVSKEQAFEILKISKAQFLQEKP